MILFISASVITGISVVVVSEPLPIFSFTLSSVASSVRFTDPLLPFIDITEPSLVLSSIKASVKFVEGLSTLFIHKYFLP